MTVHAIQIVTAMTQATTPNYTPSIGVTTDLLTAIQDRTEQTLKNTHDEQLPGQALDPSEVTGIDGGTTHIRAVWRFDQVDTQSDVLDTVEQEVVGDAEWYEVRYHDCPHDEDNGGPCSDWSAERSYGSVPSDV